jgi:uncharacterized protein YciI
MMRRAWVVIAVALAVPACGDEKSSIPAMPGTSGQSLYELGLLRRGPSWTPTRTPATDSIQAGHMANIGRMAKEGYLLAAGPLLDGGDLRGIFIFSSDSGPARLRAQVARDPAVSSGRLVMDIYSLLAPSGIGEPYRRMSARAGFRDSMIRHQLVLLKSSPKLTKEKARDERSFMIERESGELAMAGIIAGGGKNRGSEPMAGLFEVLVYRTDSATAHRRALDDPLVKAGLLVAEVHPWLAAYGTMPGDTLDGR